MTTQTQADKLKVVIQRIVLEELEAILPDILSEINIAVNEQVSHIVTETLKYSTPPEPAPRTGVSRAKIQEMIGAQFKGDTLLATTANLRTSSIDSAGATSEGADLTKALTRDYSGLMKKLNEIRPDK